MASPITGAEIIIGSFYIYCSCTRYDAIVQSLAGWCYGTEVVGLGGRESCEEQENDRQ